VIDHTPVIIEEFAQSAASIADSDNKTSGEVDGNEGGNSTQSSPAWKAEATIAIVWLVILWLVHVSGFFSSQTL